VSGDFHIRTEHDRKSKTDTTTRTRKKFFVSSKRGILITIFFLPMEHAPSTNLSGTPREQPRLRPITGEGTFSKPRSSDHEHPSGVHKIAQKETIKTDDLKTKNKIM
jgi:hypothetical protein